MNRHTDINTPSQRQPGIKMNEHTHPDKRQGRTAYQTGTFEKVAQVGWTMKQLQKIAFRHLSLLLLSFINIINKLHLIILTNRKGPARLFRLPG